MWQLTKFSPLFATHSLERILSQNKRIINNHRTKDHSSYGILHTIFIGNNALCIRCKHIIRIEKYVDKFLCQPDYKQSCYTEGSPHTLSQGWVNSSMRSLSSNQFLLHCLRHRKTHAITTSNM